MAQDSRQGLCGSGCGVTRQLVTMTKDSKLGLMFSTFAGVALGLAVGMLFFSSNVYEGRVELGVGIQCGFWGGLIGLIIGKLGWSIASGSMRGRFLARLITLMIFVGACGAAMGWQLGRELSIKVEQNAADRLIGMKLGAILGCVIGIGLALLDWFLLHEFDDPNQLERSQGEATRE
jgi:hypothetical protein